MALYPEQLDDFNFAVHNAVARKGNWVDLSMPFQKYTFGQIVKRAAESKDYATNKLTWKLQTSNTGSFEDAGLYHRTNTTVKNLLDEGEERWTKQMCSKMYDVDEDSLNEGMYELIRLAKLRYHSMMNDWFTGMEIRIWSAPSSSTQTPRRPSGIPFWLQKSSTAAFGFNGNDPSSGFAAGRGGILTSEVPAWSNGTGNYETLTDDDGIDLLKKATEFCYFEAPDSFAEIAGGMPDWSFYTTYPVVETLRKYLRAQNDNLGPDVFAMRGQVLVGGTPMVWVPALTQSTSDAYDSTDPIYGVNWNTMKWFFRKGMNKRVTRPLTPSDMPDVRKVYLTNWGNLVCYNLRGNFVIHNPA